MNRSRPLLLPLALLPLTARAISFSHPDLVSVIAGVPTLPPGLPYSENVSPEEVSMFLSRQSAYYASQTNEAPWYLPSGTINAPAPAATTAPPHTTVAPASASASAMTSFLSSMEGVQYPELSDCVFTIFAGAFADVDVDLCPYSAPGSTGLTGRVNCLCSNYPRDIVTGVFPATACPYNGYDYASRAVMSVCQTLANVAVPASNVATSTGAAIVPASTTVSSATTGGAGGYGYYYGDSTATSSTSLSSSTSPTPTMSSFTIGVPTSVLSTTLVVTPPQPAVSSIALSAISSTEVSSAPMASTLPESATTTARGVASVLAAGAAVVTGHSAATPLRMLDKVVSAFSICALSAAMVGAVLIV